MAKSLKRNRALSTAHSSKNRSGHKPTSKGAGKSRTGTKQARAVVLLRSANGATIDGLMKVIPVTENGKTRRLPALLVMLRRLANDGLRGDKKAIQFLLNLVDRYGEASQALPQLHELLEEDGEILARYAGESVREKASQAPEKSHGPG